MKTITITCTWESTHEIEVPDDFEVPDSLDGFPPEVLDEIDSSTASLVDWK
jgi:hypothetical protein